LKIEDLANTILVVVMPPQEVEGIAYYFQQFVKIGGTRLFLFTENLGSPNDSTPIKPYKDFQEALAGRHGFDLCAKNEGTLNTSITAIGFSESFNCQFKHLGAKEFTAFNKIESSALAQCQFFHQKEKNDQIDMQNPDAHLCTM